MYINDILWEQMSLLLIAPHSKKEYREKHRRKNWEQLLGNVAQSASWIIYSCKVKYIKGSAWGVAELVIPFDERVEFNHFMSRYKQHLKHICIHSS